MWAFIVEKHSQLLLIDNSFEGMPLGSLNALPCTTMSLWKEVFVYDADSWSLSFLKKNHLRF